MTIYELALKTGRPVEAVLDRLQDPVIADLFVKANTEGPAPHGRRNARRGGCSLRRIQQTESGMRED